MKKATIGSSLLLFLAACIWGFAFVAQSVGMDYMGPYTFNGARFLIGGLVLLPLVFVRIRKKRNTPEAVKRRITITGGICCGLAICAASLFQQFGILHTTVGKAGFITTLYIVIVPVLGIFMRKKIQGKIWIAVLMAVAGMYLLCITESFSIGRGDALVCVCALLFSVHILVIDYFAPKTDGVALSCIQFFTAGVICTMGALCTEQPSWEQLAAGALPVLYAGAMSCGIAYTLQIIGQKNMEPAAASLILSMESVISVLAGWLILGQAMSLKELAGCVLVFAAVILVQLQEKPKSEKKA